MERDVKILIACGSGIATSTVVQEKVKQFLKEADIPAKISKCSLNEIAGKQDSVDIIMVTSNYKKPLNKPCLSVFGLISGINEAKIKNEILELCKKIENE
jgi:PTS system galactitol-specific IIB component